MNTGVLGSFHTLDWIVLVGATLLVTFLGDRLAGRAKTERAFFLGNKTLPWWAVSASIVATEISAVTFIAFPASVWVEGGNLTYLQIGLIGSGIARLVIGFVLVPAYFEREIYSPYEYMGERLGAGARRVATALFTVGGVLGQAARVFLIAVVLEVLLARELASLEAALGIPPLVAAVSAIALVATVWTWAGGIRTVIWTDALLFLLFMTGIASVLLHAHLTLDGGLPGVVSAGWDAGKLQFFDFEPTLTKPYTFWAALIAASWSGVGFYGTDQLLAQRLFCCRDARAARLAITTSIVAVAVILLVGLIGVCLWSWTEAQPLTGTAADLVAAKSARIFPVYILSELPNGLRGLVVAGAFAAAISSLDSILAALAQTSLTSVVRPIQRALGVRTEDQAEGSFLRQTRLLIVFWAVVLAMVAIALNPVSERYKSLLDLALAMASYTGGALIAGFFLAFREVRNAGSGFVWSAPLSVLGVFAVAWPTPIFGDTPLWILLASMSPLILLWLWQRSRLDLRASPSFRGAIPTLWFLAACTGLATLVCFGVVWVGGVPKAVAWPWYVPLGSTVAYLFGVLLRSPCESDSLA